ncbi:MAG: MFS transporter [Acidobacteriota bacterium]|nr:MFS transporter [Acidobacteriota bacterium]
MSHRSKLFYGWWVVLTAAVGLCLGAGPLTVFAFGVFFAPLTHDFLAGRAAVSFAFTLHNLTSSFSAPLVGRLMDRFGARRVILPLTTAFGLILLSGRALAGSIFYFYLFYAALGVVSPGTSPVAYGLVVSRWFDRRRGLALGLVMLGVGVGAIIIPPAAQRLIAAFGWRSAYALLGCAVLLIALPVVGIFLREDPAQLGLTPDGGEQPAEHLQVEPGSEGLSWHEIRHTPSFWLMLFIFFLVGASVHACVIHMPALLSDRGMGAGDAALGSSVVGAALLTGRCGTGYLLDRFFAPRVAIVLFLGAAAGMALLWLGGAGAVALVAAFLVGLGMGAEADIIAYLISRYFGLRAFGTAYGFGFGTFTLAGAVGAFLMGAGYDVTHSYGTPLAGFCTALLLAAALLTRLGPYRYAVLRAGWRQPAVRDRAGSPA